VRAIGIVVVPIHLRALTEDVRWEMSQLVQEQAAREQSEQALKQQSQEAKAK
jgi:hypothetical protein